MSRKPGDHKLNLLLEHEIDLDSKVVFLPPPHVDETGEETFEITPSNIRKSLKLLHFLDKRNSELPIIIYLNTEGGCWDSGIALYNYIKSMNSFSEIIVLGTAYSMGSVILQAGGHRKMYENSRVMIHAGEDGMYGHPKAVNSWNREASRTLSTMYKIFQEKMKDIPRCRSLPQPIVQIMEKYRFPFQGKGFSLLELETIFDQDIVLNAKEALALNLIDEIIKPND